ncbi:MAG: tetratricopeptide repeat protein [Candidatus Omnitrophota bacterium]
MPFIIILIVILGIAIGVITFFLIKSIIMPQKVATLSTLLKQGKTASVTRLAKQIIAKEPRNVEAHYLLGQAYLAENKPELALMEFKTVNQIGNFGGICPEKQFRKTIAELYKKFRQPEEALKEYLLLIKLEGDNADYYYKAGELFEERDRPDKAVNYYRKTIELDSRHSMAHYRLGQVLYRAKKPVEAKNELELAIKLQPDNFKAYFYIGRLLKENHDYIGALHAFEKAQRDTEFKVKALVERGACYMSMNSFESAITELERAVKSAENDSSAEILFGRYFLAMCYEKTRNIDKAIENWEFIYSKKSTFKDVAEKLAQYQELRADDKVKDFLTVSMPEFLEICKAVAMNMGLSIREIAEIPNGCQIFAVESDSKWRNIRKMPKLIRFLRVADLIDDSAVRSMHEEMKNLSITRGVIVASSNFSRKAIEFAETRPIDLLNKDKLQGLLKNINLAEISRGT